MNRPLGSRPRPIGDDLLVHRAARTVALQTAALVAGAILLLVVLVTAVVVRGQQSAADETLRTTVRTADDVDDPPPGVWLVLAEHGRELSTSGLPPELRPALAGLRAAATGSPRLAGLSGGDDREYRVATVRRGAETVQAVLDLAANHDQRARLFRSMAAASALGLLFAVALGIVIGRRAVRPLAQALALQRAFVADASHELRTPLTLLSTRAQVLDRAIQAGGLDAQAREDSRGLVGDVQRLGEVVEDLLVAADPRTDGQHVPVDLAAVVRSAVDSARAHSEQAGVRLSEQRAPDASYQVSGSEAALRRAVLALVDNAIDHSPAGGAVAVALRRERRSVVLAVSDSGPGIAPEDAARVLRRFESGGHRAGRTHYGLGLALTHDLANRHGGQLRLADSATGATFELVLPALDLDAPRNG